MCIEQKCGNCPSFHPKDDGKSANGVAVGVCTNDEFNRPNVTSASKPIKGGLVIETGTRYPTCLDEMLLYKSAKQLLAADLQVSEPGEPVLVYKSEV